MDSPIFSKVDDWGLWEVFPQFTRLSDEKTGEIYIEYGAGHLAPGHKLLKIEHVPDGSICLDGGWCKRRPSPLVIRSNGQCADLIPHILAMKTADVSHMQRDDNGCGPAVVAHLTRSSYADAVRKLYADGKVRILGTQRLADATGTVRSKCKSGTWDEAENANAVAALIKNTDPRLGRHYGHYVSIDPGMVIVDPELVLHYPLAEYPRRAWSVLMYFVRA